MVAARTMPQANYLAVAKRFNTDSATKVTFSSSDYGPEAVTAMCKAFGVMSPAAFTEYQLMRINEDKTYTLVSERFGPDGVKKLMEDANKKRENDELVDRLVAELAKLPSKDTPTGDEPVYTSYKLGEAA